MENAKSKFEHIKGWGADIDPENEPTYPMKNYTGDDHSRLDYTKPSQQQPDVEVLMSNERPGLPAVFGTASPPSGLSGILRRLAYKKSESSYGHWLPLFLADRINVFEGIIDDIRHGHVPNFFAERGWKADWKYNRKSVITKLLISSVVISTGAILLTVKSGKRKSIKKKIKRYF